MRRRAVLRAALGLAGLLGTGPVGARAELGRNGTDNPTAAYTPLGHLELPGAADCRVSTDGETAFVAVDDGFVAVAVPAMRPRSAVRSIEADRADGPLTGVADLAVDGDRLLVPGPAGPRRDRIAGFALFDVADPARPAQVAFYETDFAIHNAALADGRAYLTAGLSLVVVDVTEDEPVEVGRWSLAAADPRWADVAPALRVLHDIRIRGDLAVLSQWDAGTWLVDVGSPDAIDVVGRAGGRPVDALAAVPDDDVRTEAVQLPGNHHSAAVSDDGSLLAVGAEAFGVAAGDGPSASPTAAAGRQESPGSRDVGGGPGGTDLYDLADPSSPTHLATIAPPRLAGDVPRGAWTTAHDFAFDGDRLLSAWYQGGVRVHDVSRPTAPTELARWSRPAEAAFWTARPAVGDTFVAPTTTLPGGDLRSGLYLFPTRPGVPAGQLTQPDPSTPTASPTQTPTPKRTPGQPGFGPATALGGLAGLAAWRRWRRRRGGE